MGDDFGEKLLASAVQFLIEGGEEDAASVLLSCDLYFRESGDTSYSGDEIHQATHVSITGPRAAYETLSDKDHPIRRAVVEAIKALLPEHYYMKHFTVRAEFIAELDPGWRSELLEIARGRGMHNQAADPKWTRVWKNLRFRSESEVRIAQALDRHAVLFLPNCKARVGSTDGRENRESDFLTCYRGKWGILEVDGEPFHPPARAVEDHERDRLFKRHGVSVVEHFDANRCYNDAEGVVRIFLDLLERA